MTDAVRLLPLADAPEHVSALAAAYEAEWEPYYGPDGPGDAEADLRAACRSLEPGTVDLPHAVVAVDDAGGLLGVVALRRDSPGSDRHPGVWLAGLLVLPEARGRGVAARLVEGAVDAARTMGLRSLFVSTQLESLVRDWTRIGQAATLRADVPVYRLELAHSDKGPATGT